MSAPFFNKFDINFSKHKIRGKYVLLGLGMGLSVAYYYKLRGYIAGCWCHLEKDLSGKNIVITGGNDGIGKQTARRLKELNANIIIGSRDEKKNNQTIQQLSKLGKGKIVAFKLDLADKNSIENFATNVNKQLLGQPLQYLLNNAGLFSIPQFKKTQQDLEMQIGVNHFGHFYLTYLLWQKLKQSNNPRVVNVSSKSHQSILKSHDLDMSNLHFQNGGYSSYTAYSHSKKANILFTKQLQRRMDQADLKGIALSLHPGPVRTGITKQITSNLTGKVLHTLFTPFLMLAFKTPIEGAQTNIYCILQDDANLVKGGYYQDCHIASTRSPLVEDPQLAKKLWVESEKTFGIKFDV